MTERYQLKNIRTLLVEGFSDDELRRLCFDEFEQVYNKLARNTGKAEIVDLLLDYAKQKAQIETLLAWAKEHNPSRYQMLEPYVEVTTNPTPFTDFSREPEGTMPRVNDSSSAPPNKAKSSRPLSVFLSHSASDKHAVRKLYRRLKAEGIDPWFDEEKLLPGQDWKLEIRKAIRASDIVIVCLSSVSVTKAGYVQREIRDALDIADEQPEGAIFLIPLKLDECKVPERLGHWHWVNLFEEHGYDKLLRALQKRAEDIGTFVPSLLAPKKHLSKSSILRSRQSRLLVGGSSLLTVVILAGILVAYEPTFSMTPTPTPTPSDTVPGIAATPTSIPTPSPTSTPTDTPKPPTATSLPTSIPTHTPTDTATSTPTQTATSIPDTPTLTPTPTQLVIITVPASPPSPTATATPTVPIGQIILLKPSSDAGPSSGMTEFEWQWSGPIAANQGFEVRVWREGEPPAGVHNAVEDNQKGIIAPLGNNTYRLNVDIRNSFGVKGRTGEYWWTVALVQISPEYKDLGIQAAPGHLYFAAGGGDGGGDGGGAVIH